MVIAPPTRFKYGGAIWYNEYFNSVQLTDRE
jgi:hypothetical protein